MVQRIDDLYDELEHLKGRFEKHLARYNGEKGGRPPAVPVPMPTAESDRREHAEITPGARAQIDERLLEDGDALADEMFSQAMVWDDLARFRRKGT